MTPSTEEAPPQLKAEFLRATQSRTMAEPFEHHDIEATLKQYPDAIHWRYDQSGMTGLMFAAENGKTEFVKILLKHGADTEARNSEGKTALMMAARNSSPDTRDVAACLL